MIPVPPPVPRKPADDEDSQQAELQALIGLPLSSLPVKPGIPIAPPPVPETVASSYANPVSSGSDDDDEPIGYMPLPFVDDIFSTSMLNPAPSTELATHEPSSKPLRDAEGDLATNPPPGVSEALQTPHASDTGVVRDDETEIATINPQDVADDNLNSTVGEPVDTSTGRDTTETDSVESQDDSVDSGTQAPTFTPPPVLDDNSYNSYLANLIAESSGTVTEEETNDSGVDSSNTPSTPSLGAHSSSEQEAHHNISIERGIMSETSVDTESESTGPGAPETADKEDASSASTQNQQPGQELWGISLPDYQLATETVVQNFDEDEESDAAEHEITPEDVKDQELLPAELPPREEPILGSFYHDNVVGPVTYPEPLTEEDEPQEKLSFPTHEPYLLPGMTDDPEDVDANPMLVYDEDEDFNETLEVRRKRLMREVRIKSETNAAVPSLDPEAVKGIRPKKPMNKSAYIGLVAALFLITASIATGMFMLRNENNLQEQQALIDAEYSQDASVVTEHIACGGWDIREDKTSFTKNLTCFDEGSNVQVLYSRGPITEEQVWPRAANMLEEDAFVVTDHQHWGAIAAKEETLQTLSEAKGQPICNLRAGGSLECPQPAQ